MSNYRTIEEDLAGLTAYGVKSELKDIQKEVQLLANKVYALLIRIEQLDNDAHIHCYQCQKKGTIKFGEEK